MVKILQWGWHLKLSPLRIPSSTISIIYTTHIDVGSRIDNKDKFFWDRSHLQIPFLKRKLIFCLFFSISVLEQLRISHDPWLVSHAWCLENNMDGYQLSLWVLHTWYMWLNTLHRRFKHMYWQFLHLWYFLHLWLPITFVVAWTPLLHLWGVILTFVVKILLH